MTGHAAPAGNVAASVVDGALVVRTGGENPRLWRAPLATVTHATLLVDGNRLVLSRTGAGEEEIAVFADKAQAQAAFATVSDVLMRGAAPVAPAPSVVTVAVPARQPLLLRLAKGLFKFLLWVAFLAMVAFIALQLFIITRIGDRMMPPREMAPVTAPAAPQAPATPQGVPVPADQLFED